MTFDHWRKGLLRLYIVLAVPWALWFGYAGYDAHRVYSINREYVEVLNDKGREKNWSDYYRRSGFRDEYQQLRDEKLTWLLLISVGYPVAMLVFLWVVAGFQDSELTALNL